MRIFFLLFLIFNPFYTTASISFLKINNQESFNITSENFWYFDFLKSFNFFHKRGGGVQIVTLDAVKLINNSDRNKIKCLSQNLSYNERNKVIQLINQKNKNLSLCGTKKILNLKSILKKYHASITADLIEQIAPLANIKVIPIKNSSQAEAKIEFYKSLQQALVINPDILLINLQVINFDPNQKIDKKILALFKKFKCVIAPSGNNGYINKKVGFPANCPFVISVGSLTNDGSNYKISDFCQTKDKVDIFMPGENLLSEIWIEELEDYFIIPVSGTSMAAALATGCMACLLKTKMSRPNILKKYSKRHIRIRPIM